jgi:hypothetical protein
VSTSDSASGTRFLLYPQAPTTPGYDKPELVWVSDLQGTIHPGPKNDRMYVSDPLQWKEPYEFPNLPPFNGGMYPPTEPSPDGHFDHIDPSDRAFLGVHAFGCVVRILDVWESYLGHRIQWHFADKYERLEIIPLIEWDNAQSGYGYLEFGYDVSNAGERHPYALNFDVIAHEIGHSILFAEVGLPGDGFSPGPDFVAFHEGTSDLISLIGMLHFDTSMDRLLRRGSGNLLAMNELNQFAELADERQVRIAGNARRMSEVGQEPHDKSRPFTGAFFDSIVEIYHDMAVEQGLVDLPKRSIMDARDLDLDIADSFKKAFAADYDMKHFPLKACLSDARDIMAKALASTWANLDNDRLTFVNAGYAVCDALQESGHGDAAETVMESLVWREILNPFDSAMIGRHQRRSAQWI